MKLFLFSILDVKSGVYLVPFPARSETDAVRSVASSKSDPAIADTPIATHPQDFSLMLLGCFDDESGVISAVQPFCVATLASIFGSDRSSTVSS